jgi:O-antigen/teichoic acid export membrane protein
VVVAVAVLFPRSLSILFFDGEGYSREVLAIAIGIIPNCFNRVFNGALNGKGFVWQSIMLNETLMTFLLSSVLIFCFYLINIPLNSIEICWAYTISRFLVCIVSYTLVYRIAKLKIEVFRVNFREIKKTINLYLVTLIAVFNSTFDLLVISLVLSNYELGIYSIVSRIAISLIIITQVTNTVLNPKIANLYHSKKIKDLKFLLKKAILLLGTVSSLLFLLIVFTGKPILGIWGSEFVGAYKVLIVVCFGQMVNATLSPVGSILIMCGGEKDLKFLLFATFLLSVAVIPFVAREFGLMGVALSFSTLLIVQNLIVCFITRRYLKTNVA